MFKFFKKKINKIGPERAKELGLITEDEFFRLRYERAKEDWENCTNKNKKKKK